MKKIKSLILLSGGLDSLVSLGLKKEELNITLALTFDYGQKSLQKELDASEKICKFYNIEQVVIKLNWLKDITTTALVSEEKIPSGQTLKTARAVWVPNRNGLFLNAACCFADAQDFDYIVIGANKQEAETFSDNTAEFIDAINKEFEFSTQKHPKVTAPLIDCNKNDIVALALKNGVPLELTMSCYDSTSGHCGKCDSCVRLKNALKFNGDTKYTKVLFK